MTPIFVNITFVIGVTPTKGQPIVLEDPNVIRKLNPEIIVDRIFVFSINSTYVSSSKIAAI